MGEKGLLLYLHNRFDISGLSGTLLWSNLNHNIPRCRRNDNKLAKLILCLYLDSLTFCGHFWLSRSTENLQWGLLRAISSPSWTTHTPSAYLHRRGAHSNKSMSFLHWGPQSWTQYSGWGLRRAERENHLPWLLLQKSRDHNALFDVNITLK